MNECNAIHLLTVDVLRSVRFNAAHVGLNAEFLGGRCLYFEPHRTVSSVLYLQLLTHIIIEGAYKQKELQTAGK